MGINFTISLIILILDPFPTAAGAEESLIGDSDLAAVVPGAMLEAFISNLILE